MSAKPLSGGSGQMPISTGWIRNPSRHGEAQPGGHLVALLGTSGGVKALEGDLGNASYSSRVQAVIDFGPTDFSKLDPARKKPRNDSRNSPESKLVGGPLEERSELVRLANPITFISGDDPPFLILHGDLDDVVPPNQSELLFKALREAGVPAEYHVLPGRAHGFRTGPDIDPLLNTFLDRVAKNSRH